MNESTDAVSSPKRPRAPEVTGVAKEIEDYIVPLTSMQEELARVKAELKETKDALRIQEDLVSERDGQIYNLKAKVRQLKDYRNIYRHKADSNEFYVNQYREKFGPLGETPFFTYPEYSDSGSEVGSVQTEYFETQRSDSDS